MPRASYRRLQSLFFRDKDSFVVGQAANDAMAGDPARYAGDIKQALGKPGWQFDAFGKPYLAQELAALVLRRLATDVVEATGIDMRDAVITCPASSGPNEIAATRQAGQLAGLNVLGTISDPAAAAYAFGFNQATDQVILVYDLGAGSFDLTLLETSQREVNVLAATSRDDLGGDRWDEALARYLAEQFESQTGSAVRETILRYDGCRRQARPHGPRLHLGTHVARRPQRFGRIDAREVR